MHAQILEFLNKRGVCSFAALLPDGSPHAAALHFSFNSSPFELYILTKNTSRKTKGLLNGETVRGSVVVGFSDEELITLQMDGDVVAVTSKSQLNDTQKIHFEKHPNMRRHLEDPAYIFLKFSPEWWRYTNYNTKPITILTSEP